MLNLRNNLYTKNIITELVRYARTNSRMEKRKAQDPGIKLRMKLLAGKQESSLETFDLEKLEADFNDLNMSHRDHLDEIAAMKEKEKYHIVKQKYFKEKFPNFLTWADKEQIKHLYNTNPNEWTVKKLSEGFPALPETIHKIIKSNWTKKNINKIRNHDDSVQENWNSFKQGMLKDIPTYLSEHLNKFSNRKLNFNLTDLPHKIENVAPSNSLVQGEFSEIITSYKKIINKTINSSESNLTIYESNDKHIRKKPLKEMYVTSNNSDFEIKKNITLSAYKNRLENDLQTGNVLEEDDKIILTELNHKIKQPIEHKELELKQVKFANKNGQLQVYKKSNDVQLEYPEKIIIPKDKRNRGYTYKLNDCYYDVDGEFLYRVPGMK